MRFTISFIFFFKLSLNTEKQTETILVINKTTRSGYPEKYVIHVACAKLIGLIYLYVGLSVRRSNIPHETVIQRKHVIYIACSKLIGVIHLYAGIK